MGVFDGVLSKSSSVFTIQHSSSMIFFAMAISAGANLYSSSEVIGTHSILSWTVKVKLWSAITVSSAKSFIAPSAYWYSHGVE